MTSRSATAIGFVAILFWAVLTLFTIASAPVPPFLLIALSFSVGGLMGAGWLTATGKWGELRNVPLAVYVFGTLGVFGFHFLFFSAIRLAPPAEASLINYLWPLLIVLFSGLLPGENLRWGHIIGALIAFVGAALLIIGDGGFNGKLPVGYLFAIASALTWSSYSVLSRRLGDIPTSAVTVFCGASAALAVLCHFLFETTAWPEHFGGWLAILALGLGPTGGAFFVWDIGMKKGNIQVLGTAAYAAPLLSTLILVFAGMAEATRSLLIAAVLITCGAALAGLAARRDKA